MRHLRSQHMFNNEAIEPYTIKSFSLLVLHTPISKTIFKHKKIIKAYVDGKCDLPKNLYAEIENQFDRYKKMNGMKPLLRIAQSNSNSQNKTLRKKADKYIRKQQNTQNMDTGHIDAKITENI